MVIETSWDDGNIKDLYLAKLLQKYNLPGIFYIPSRCNLGEQDINTLVAGGFEIGGHTVSHPHDLKKLPSDELDREIRGNKTWLESFGPVTKFCYPRGRYNDEVKDAVKSIGFESARTTKVGYITLPVDHFEMHTTVHAFNRREYGGKSWWIYAMEKFMEAKRVDGYFHLWGHSWEVDRNKDWDHLDSIFKLISNNLSLKN